ncbi:HIT domain-containing protein [Niveibacterium sp. SC-1]|uniref:HIT family protein n=1 Tax=Niveibacterium sp. SC-1 TaxID=3135646 RepID=UPI0031205173
MNSCIFCEIVKGECESSRVHEDAFSIGFMALEPVNPGHVLLMPKAHYEDMFLAPQEEIARLLPVANAIATALKRIYQAPRVVLVAAGLVVPHAHWHIAPIYTPHDITSRAELEGMLKLAARSELDAIAADIRAAMVLPG